MLSSISDTPISWLSVALSTYLAFRRRKGDPACACPTSITVTFFLKSSGMVIGRIGRICLRLGMILTFAVEPVRFFTHPDIRSPYDVREIFWPIRLEYNPGGTPRTISPFTKSLILKAMAEMASHAI